MDIRKHNELLRKWFEGNKPCILCGVNKADEKDHLPPKTLYPKSLRTDKTVFFTFPACAACNRNTSDSDFLLSVYLAFYLPQSEFKKGLPASHPDHVALLEQWKSQLADQKNGHRKAKLIKPYVGEPDNNGAGRIFYTKIPVNESLIKFTKALYWFETSGYVLENYRPGWWIFQDIDTSEIHYLEKLLKGSQSTVQWEDRFIAHYMLGLPENAAGGFISSSLHFYTERMVGKGANWHLIAAPTTTIHKGISLFEHFAEVMGDPTIEPNMVE